MNLKPLVNDKALWSSFQQELQERLNCVHKNLEQHSDSSELYRLQGEARALRKLFNLREQVNNG